MRTSIDTAVDEEIRSVAVGHSEVVALLASHKHLKILVGSAGKQIPRFSTVWSRVGTFDFSRVRLSFHGEGNPGGFFTISFIDEETTFWSKGGRHWELLPVKASSVGYFRYSQSWIAASIGQSYVSYDGTRWLPDVPINSMSTFSYYQQSRQFMNAVAVSSLDDSVYTGHL